MEKQTCVICKEEFVGYGNNPEPVKPIEEGQCCDDCNSAFVIPARILEITKESNNKTK